MIESFLDSLGFVQWQLFIAFLILLFRILIAPLLPFKYWSLFFLGFLFSLTIWTWVHTFSYVFIIQMVVIVVVGIFASEIEFWLPPTISIVFLSILSIFISYDLWNTWDKKTYQCRPPQCAQKEKVICKIQKWEIPNGIEVKETCKTEISKKVFSFSHCKNTSGYTTYGAWENQTCFDEIGKVISEYDMD